MSYLEHNQKFVPTGFRKILYFNWPLFLLISTVSGIGFLMLYSVAGGSLDPWARDQMGRFGMGVVAMFFIAMVPIWFWRNIAFLGYLFALALLLAVEFVGVQSMGAQRWVNLGFMVLQPSELMKIALVMLLAAYYN